MIIAVTYSNGEIFSHFGKSEQFKLYEVTDNKISSSKVVNTNGAGHGALSGFLKNLNVNILICGGMGQGAKDAMKEAKIDVYCGVSGACDAAVNDFLSDKLKYDSDFTCNHHSHEAEHTCH